ncbi:MAG: hypothetical protein PHO10_09220 [Gemmiger sp.]|nr:hypothetical protein [Gemmiger sp.]
MKRMDTKKHKALGFLLVALAAAGRALLGVPGDSSMAEVSLTLLAAMGVLLLGSSQRLALLPAAGQFLLELVLCGTHNQGVWRWLRPAIRLADLWLLFGMMYLLLTDANTANTPNSPPLQKGRRPLLAAAAVTLSVQTVLMVWLVLRPALQPLQLANSAVFIVFSGLLLWYTVLLLRRYNALRTP